MNEVMFFTGQTTTVHLPSGRVVDIRETNGADDELLSNLYDVKDSMNIVKFLTSIIVLDHNLGRAPLASEVLNYHLNDKWYLMLKQRLINRGVELVFAYKCPCDKCKDKPKAEYTEDLAPLDGDLKNPSYKPSATQVMRYPLGIELHREFRTSSGHLFKYDIMTTVHEKRQLDLTDKEQTRNSIMTLRNLKVKNGEEWLTVTSFAPFSSKVVSEIRADIKKHDPEFMPLINGECPAEVPFTISLWGIPDFFWPGEEI